MYEVIKNLRSNPLEVHNLAKWFTFFVRYRECGCVGERERERERESIFETGQTISKNEGDKKLFLGREPWSSGYGRRLMFRRSGVQIPAPYTGWTFFTYILCKNCNDVCLKRQKINKKRRVLAHFLKKQLILR